MDLIVETAEDLALILEDTLTWRQLRQLAKRNRIHQYSYLGKRGLAICLAYKAENRAKRYTKTVAKLDVTL
jgi:hypothetical protein